MKKQILIFVLVVLPMVVRAYDFESDGIGYNIISVEEKTVNVSGITTTGDIVIPDKVFFNNIWFSVISISSLYGSKKNSSIKFNSIINTDGPKLYASGTAYFYVDESNPYMKAVDGVLYSKDMTRLISFPPYKYCEDFVIPESVTAIDDYSFGANRYIKRLTFNDNIEELPENFLYGVDYSGCINYLNLSDKISVIHGRCLNSLSSLKEIILPKNLEEVEKDQSWSYYGLPTELTDITIFNSKIANYVYKLSPSLHVFSRFNQLANFHVKDSNPVEIDEDIFTEGKYFTINLYVPKGTKNIYENLKGWKNFYNIIEENVEPQVKEKCATPTISYKDGKFSFECATEGVEFVSEITSNDVKKYYDNEISLTKIYKLTVYAVKAGYENSDIATKDIKLSVGEKGDVNGDGKVSITDAVSVVNIILNQDSESAAPARLYEVETEKTADPE